MAGKSGDRETVVYRIVNSVNGKSYIGVTCAGLAKRRREHLHAARRNADKGRSRIYNAIRKHGEDCFRFEIIETLPTYAEALKREIELIAASNPKYNITAGGQGVLGLRHSPEILARIAGKLRGKPGYWRGRKRPDIAAKASARLKGKPIPHWQRPQSEETRAKISAAKKGRKRGPITDLQRSTFVENMRRAARGRRKEVLSVRDSIRFPSAVAAAAHYGLNAFAVASVASGRRNSVFGHQFKYLGEAS